MEHKPDVRALIADALREHRFERCSVFSKRGFFQWWGCCAGCGFEGKRRTINGPEWELNMRDDEAHHTADVLLSLPGIAIVELPSFNDDELCFVGGGYGFIGYDAGDGHPLVSVGMTRPHLSPQAARSVAAALLAAAAAAEAAAEAGDR